MTEFFNVTEAEELDLFGGEEDTEDYDAGESYDSEAFDETYYPSAYHRKLARARAEARARAQARARGQRYPIVPSRPQQRPSYFPPTPRGPESAAQVVRQGFGRVGADIQRTQAAVRNVDLDNKVQAEAFGSVLKAQQKRIGGSETALAVSKVVDELKVQFPDLFDNPIIRTGLPLAPLLFLVPQKRGSGFGSVISDPRVWGSALVAGIALFNETRKQEPRELTVTPNAAVLKNGDFKAFSAVARDVRGREISGQSITWKSSDDKIATVDASGIVKANAVGPVIITAIANTNVQNSAMVTIV